MSEEKDALLEVDYGPLEGLIGVWTGDKGYDVSPEPDGQVDSPYFEKLVIEPAGELTNAKTQRIAMLRYHQEVRRKSNQEVFHDQVGYWMWDPAAGLVMQNLAVPRSTCLLAGGGFTIGEDGAVTITVKAKAGSSDWGVAQSTFMLENAKTVAFEQAITLKGDSLKYKETTFLEIYGRSFDHTDENELRRQ